MIRTPLRWLVLLVAAFGVVQLLSLGLAALRPPPPPVVFANPGSLVDPRAPSDGPADPSGAAVVTIVLFSDYACPVCRAQHPGIHDVIAADGRVRLVYRDWAIFGTASVRAARLAIASVAQGRHPAFDDALMRGRIDEPGLRAAAAKAGLDWQRLEADAAVPEIGALLDDTDRTARGLQFAGTPVMVIGQYLVVGKVSPRQLRDLIAKMRGPRS